jgi:hypothetical protein
MKIGYIRMLKLMEFYKEATRSRHSSFAFIPYPTLRYALTNLTVLKRIVKNRDKGKGF